MKTIRKAILSFSVVVCVVTILLPAVNVPAQNLFVADYNGGNIYEYTPGGSQSTFATGLNEPTALAFDSQGDLLVAEASGTVVKIKASGSQSDIVSGLSGVTSEAVDSKGNIYVSQENGLIIIVTPKGMKYVFATGLPSPYALEFDGNGNLLVSCSGTGQIISIAPNGTKSIYASGLNGPRSMSFDGSGNLYVATVGPPGSVIEISPARAQTTVSTTALANPLGLAIDSAGNVFVANNGNGTIAEIGTNSGTFASGLNSGSPYGLAFQPVPRLQAAASNRTFHLTITEPSPYLATIVQASTDLVSWTNIYTNTPPFTYTDSLTPPWRFYRGLVDTNSY